MYSFWFFFLKKQQFTWLLMLSLIGLGTYALFLIPKESAPEIIVPIAIVTTVYPGASASDIEELVTNKLEANFENLANLKKLTSTSRDSVSSITVEFNPNANVDKSIQKVKDAVDITKNDLPADAQTPFVTEVNFADQPIQVISVSSNLDPVAFTQLGQDLADRFKTVSGVAKVEVSGTRNRQIQIAVKAEALATYGLTIADITQALAGANLSLPVGTIITDGIEYSIRFEGKIISAKEIENIPIRPKNGFPIYIGDIASVYDGVSTLSSISRVSVDGAPSEKSLTLSIYKKSGFDVTTMSKGVYQELDSLKKPGNLLDSSQVLIVFDKGKQVTKDLTDLVRAGTETVVLVILTLLITIGWRESLVAALSIPLSFVIAFIGLYLSGNTINSVSLFALILAVGILVDSGIVITEAIHTRLQKYNDPHKAAMAAIREYAWPLIGGTMTTIAVFAPLFFLSGITGKFIASIPFTIIFVLIASIFVALGLVPLLAILLSNKVKPNRLELIQEDYTHRIQRWYRAWLISFLQKKKAQKVFLWSLFLALLLAFSLPVTGMLKVIFFPAENVDFVYVNIETKQGNPVTKTDLAVRQVEEVLYSKKYIESFSSTAGSGSSFTGSTDSGGKFANITIALKPTRTETSLQITNDLRKSFSTIDGAKITIQEQQNGPPSGAPVSIKFLGSDLTELAKVVEKAQGILQSIPGTRDITVSTDTNATEYVISVDSAKANAAGVSQFAIAQMLRTAVFGTVATTFKEGSTDIDVVVKLVVDQNATDPSATPEVTLDTLNNLTVMSATGNPVLLGSLVKETLAPANAAISHEGRSRVETVSAYVTSDVTASNVVTEFKARVAELELNPGVTIQYAGETEDINKFFTEMFLALIIGLILMLAILVLSFNSFRYSLYLLLAVPYSLIGVLFGLTATGLSLSFTSLLGVIALAGVIINHAIILMDSMITHKASTSENLSLLENVADAAVSRLRPIVLTTITTVVGMIPLSRISDFWGPLAYSIMFGLSFAMILTLVLVPTLFYRAELKKQLRKENK